MSSGPQHNDGVTGVIIIRNIELYTKEGGKPVSQGFFRHVHDSIFLPQQRIL